MGKEKLKSLVTSFTADGEYLAILSPDGTVRVWNTSSGSLFAQWKPENSGDSFSYMACGFVGKKRRKEQRLLIALGTDDGTVLAVDISAEFIRWRKAGALSRYVILLMEGTFALM